MINPRCHVSGARAVPSQVFRGGKKNKAQNTSLSTYGVPGPVLVNSVPGLQPLEPGS